MVNYKLFYSASNSSHIGNLGIRTILEFPSRNYDTGGHSGANSQWEMIVLIACEGSISYKSWSYMWKEFCLFSFCILFVSFWQIGLLHYKAFYIAYILLCFYLYITLLVEYWELALFYSSQYWSWVKRRWLTLLRRVCLSC